MSTMSRSPVNVLVVRGTVDTQSIWPEGISDADTIRLHVVPSTDWAWFRKDGVWRSVRELGTAVVHGTVVKPVLSTTDTLSIRLQGIDAPELHYRAPPPARSEHHDEEAHPAPTYRQAFGETTSAALHAYLASFGDQLEVEAWTAVDSPDEAFDTYGRFVGDVFVGSGSQRINVNLWLVQQGLALPTFYDSMRPEEIYQISCLAEHARAEERGLWGHYTTHVDPADPRRLYRGKRATVRDERGAVCLPKLFRRRVSWREAGIGATVQRSFLTYLRGREDRVIVKSEFLQARHERRSPRSTNFVELLDGAKLTMGPSELIFEERPSTLHWL